MSSSKVRLWVTPNQDYAVSQWVAKTIETERIRVWEERYALARVIIDDKLDRGHLFWSVAFNDFVVSKSVWKDDYVVCADKVALALVAHLSITSGSIDYESIYFSLFPHDEKNYNNPEKPKPLPQEEPERRKTIVYRAGQLIDHVKDVLFDYDSRCLVPGSLDVKDNRHPELSRYLLEKLFRNIKRVGYDFSDPPVTFAVLR